MLSQNLLAFDSLFVTEAMSVYSLHIFRHKPDAPLIEEVVEVFDSICEAKRLECHFRLFFWHKLNLEDHFWLAFFTRQLFGSSHDFLHGVTRHRGVKVVLCLVFVCEIELSLILDRLIHL